MTTRSEPRFKKRIPCKLRRDQSTFTGFVLDVSRTGLFVQTSVVAKAGDEVEITFSDRSHGASAVVSTQVAWHRHVPSQLRSAARGGLGLQIRYASEPYFVLLAEAAESSAGIRGRSAKFNNA